MPPYNRGHWQEDEHQRFLNGLKHYPSGPWTAISNIVMTRSPRQVQTHAQKYFEKIERHIRGLRRERRPSPDTPPEMMSQWGRSINRGHELDNDILSACRMAMSYGHQLPTPTRLRNEAERERAAARGLGSADAGEDSDDLSDDPEDLLPLDKSLDFLIDLLSDESALSTQDSALGLLP